MSSTEEYSSLDTKSVQEFFTRFYQISDTPGIDDEYLKQFTEDATFILGSKRSHGHAGMATRLRSEHTRNMMN